MKIGVLAVGQVPADALRKLESELPKIFPDTACSVIREPLTIAQGAYVPSRRQYSSSLVLNQIRNYAECMFGFDRVLGVADVDVFASGLNFVFGEAYSPGKAALISLWRLRPSFYGEPDNPGVFASRTLKEAVHELGHTLGLQHCPKSSCVMHFSNSIVDTDKKENLFCQQDYLQALYKIKHLREKQ